MLGDTFYTATKCLQSSSIHIFHNHIQTFIITKLTFLKYCQKTPHVEYAAPVI